MDLAHDVEHKRIDIVVQRLVIEEELGQKAEILTVKLALLAIDLVHGDRRIRHRAANQHRTCGRRNGRAIDFVARWAVDRTQRLMTQQCLLLAKILERELADVELVL